MAERAIDLYNHPTPDDAVPNLFLNTTEAGTGRIIPYTTIRVQGLATPFRSQAEIDDGSFDSVEPSASQIERLSLQDRMADDRIPLSTAAIVSARFPYLTPAGRISYSGGDYVDGGYFENSGTWLLSGLVQYLIGQQATYPAGQSPQLDAARRAVFVVVIIESEPCTRDSVDTGCAEDATTLGGSWSEALSPLRALLSTRDMRAAYSLDGLNAVSALIEQFSFTHGNQTSVADNGTGCDYPICAVTLRFRNRTRTDIPLSWVLSSQGRRSMDNAVDGMEAADVRFTAPPESTETADDTQDIDRVLGSYRRVLCMIAARTVAGLRAVAGPEIRRSGLSSEVGQQIGVRLAEIGLLVEPVTVLEHCLQLEEADGLVRNGKVNRLLDAKRAFVEQVLLPDIGVRLARLQRYHRRARSVDDGDSVRRSISGRCNSEANDRAPCPMQDLRHGCSPNP
jgi:hypothetical protein